MNTPRLWAAGLCVALSATVLASTSDAGWFCFKKKSDDCECRSCQKDQCEDDDHACCCSFCPKVPPRGQIATIIPGLINTTPEASGQSGGAEDASRLDTLEKDLTRLTLVVDEMVATQKKGQEDMARMSLLLDELIQQRAAASGILKP